MHLSLETKPFSAGDEHVENTRSLYSTLRLNGLQVGLQVNRENNSQTSRYTQLVISKLGTACSANVLSTGSLSVA